MPLIEIRNYVPRVPPLGWAKVEQLGHRHGEGWYNDEGTRIVFCRPPVKDREWNGVRVSVGSGAVLVGLGSLYQLTPCPPPKDPEAEALSQVERCLWEAIREAAPPPEPKVGDWAHTTCGTGAIVSEDFYEDFDQKRRTRWKIKLDEVEDTVFGHVAEAWFEPPSDALYELRRGGGRESGERVWPPAGLEVSIDPPALG